MNKYKFIFLFTYLVVNVLLMKSRVLIFDVTSIIITTTLYKYLLLTLHPGSTLTIDRNQLREAHPLKPCFSLRVLSFTLSLHTMGICCPQSIIYGNIFKKEERGGGGGGGGGDG